MVFRGVGVRGYDGSGGELWALGEIRNEQTQWVSICAADTHECDRESSNFRRN